MKDEQVEITYYTRNALAEKFGVHPQTIRNWEKLGLPFAKIGPRLKRYSLAEVYKWAALKDVSKNLAENIKKKR